MPSRAKLTAALSCVRAWLLLPVAGRRLARPSGLCQCLRRRCLRPAPAEGRLEVSARGAESTRKKCATERVRRSRGYAARGSTLHVAVRCARQYAARLSARGGTPRKAVRRVRRYAVQGLYTRRGLHTLWFEHCAVGRILCASVRHRESTPPREYAARGSTLHEAVRRAVHRVRL